MLCGIADLAGAWGNSPLPASPPPQVNPKRPPCSPPTCCGALAPCTGMGWLSACLMLVKGWQRMAWDIRPAHAATVDAYSVRSSFTT